MNHNKLDQMNVRDRKCVSVCKNFNELFLIVLINTMDRYLTQTQETPNVVATQVLC
jgi:hypothetical protein